MYKTSCTETSRTKGTINGEAFVRNRFRFRSVSFRFRSVFSGSNLNLKTKRYTSQHAGYDGIQRERGRPAPVALRRDFHTTIERLQSASRESRNHRPMLAGKRCRLSETMLANIKYRTFGNAYGSETLVIQIFEFLSFSGRFLLSRERNKPEFRNRSGISSECSGTNQNIPE